MAKSDGGWAFPAPAGIGDGDNMFQPGMSLRDYFAGQALAGNLANHQLTWPKYPVDLVEDCFKLADAMIAKRAKGDAE